MDLDDVAALDQALGGPLVTPEDRGYDKARTVWNGMIDKRPALIARCVDQDDVAAAVTFAGEHGLPVAIRGGGHSVAGDGTCQGGLVLDLSGLNAVEVDPTTGRVTVQPGATLADVDQATQAHGLAIPSGVVSMTGFTGLALGGGIGWLMCKHGLTCDHITAADLVTADGDQVRASQEEHPDLLWGLKGGGGNFGVVTRLELQAVDQAPTILGGANLYPAQAAEDVLAWYRVFTQEAPRELTTGVIVKTAPEGPEIPSAHRGKPVVAIALCYSGDLAEGRRVLEPLSELGKPLVEGIGEMPLVDLQSMSDQAWQAGYRDYWKSIFLETLPDDVLQAMAQRIHEMPSTIMDYKLEQMGGAIQDTAEHATAFTGRGSQYVFKINSRWDDPAEDKANIAWTRAFYQEVAAHAPGAAYVNYLARDDQDRVRQAYGPKTYDRLVELKRRWDPENTFRFNQNILP